MSNDTTRPPSLAARLDGLPVLMCGFRPFFLLAAISAAMLTGLWLVILADALPGWQPPGGVFAWHAHELLFGFGMAAISGFLLTAVPEFTGTPSAGPRRIAWMVFTWLAARAAYMASPWIGLWPAAICNLLLAVSLTVQIAPPLLRDSTRAHWSFAAALAALALLQLGFFAALIEQQHALRWLRLAVALMMVLIIMAISRISMRVVNLRIEEGRPDTSPPPEVGYLARAPRRHFAAFTILAAGIGEFLLGMHPVSGWLALAAAAAMLNLLNDWHVGRALFTRLALMLYACYWLIALGHAWMGAAWMGAPIAPSAGRHLLMTGAMGLAVFAVMWIAGRLHAGHWLDRRPWLPLAALLIVLAALTRTAASWTALLARWPYLYLLMLSGLLWASAFMLCLFYSARLWWSARTDGGRGCDEPQIEGQAGAGGCTAPSGY